MTTKVDLLARTLARANKRIDEIILAAAKMRLDEVKGKPNPVITEITFEG